MKKTAKKEVTIQDLADIIQKVNTNTLKVIKEVASSLGGKIKDLDVRLQTSEQKFDRTIKKLDIKIENLAVSTARGFQAVDVRFGQVDKKFEDMEEGMKAIRRDILNMDDRFVSRFALDEHTRRYRHVENKEKTK